MQDVHCFNTKHAEEYGLTEAILLWNFRHWLEHNKANGTNFHEGNYWTYNSVSAFKELYPYISQSKIRRALEHLENEGLIITGNFNKVKFDRTTWYAFTEKGWSLFGESIYQSDDTHLLNMTNGKDQNDKPIPDSNHIDKPNINTYERFKKPTREEVREYFKEKSFIIDADYFFDYYESVNWYRGKSKMKNWKMTANNWNAKEKKNQPSEDIYDNEYAYVF